MKRLLLGLLTLSSISAYAAINGIYNLESGSSDHGSFDIDYCPTSIQVTPDENYESIEVTEYYNYKMEESRTYINQKEKTSEGLLTINVSSDEIHAVHTAKGFIFTAPILSEYLLEELKIVSPGSQKLRRVTFNRYENPAHVECIYVLKKR